MNSNYQTIKIQPKDMTNLKLHQEYPHPFLTPSLYSPHPLSKERWGYSKRGVRDRDIFPYWFSSKNKLISDRNQVSFDQKSS